MVTGGNWTWDGIQLPSGRGWIDCTRSTPYYDGHPIADQDQDGWDDSCEYELALAFRPTMAFNFGGDCDLRNEPYYSVRGYSYGNGFADVETQIVQGFSTQPMVFYAIGYDRDCGTAGFTPHIGDSEFILLKLAWALDPDARGVAGTPAEEAARWRRGKWFVSRAFLSAHWNTDDQGSSGDYDGRDLEYRTDFRGRPRAWVSKGKHANYRSRAVCDAGAYYTDTCDGNSDADGNSTLDIVPDGNVGQSSLPLRGTFENPVVSRRFAAGLTQYAGIEYYWDTRRKFRGWSPGPSDVGATPYDVPLRFFGF